MPLRYGRASEDISILGRRRPVRGRLKRTEHDPTADHPRLRVHSRFSMGCLARNTSLQPSSRGHGGMRMVDRVLGVWTTKSSEGGRFGLSVDLAAVLFAGDRSNGHTCFPLSSHPLGRPCGHDFGAICGSGWRSVCLCTQALCAYGGSGRGTNAIQRRLVFWVLEAPEYSIAGSPYLDGKEIAPDPGDEPETCEVRAAQVPVDVAPENYGNP